MPFQNAILLSERLDSNPENYLMKFNSMQTTG